MPEPIDADAALAAAMATVIGMNDTSSGVTMDASGTSTAVPKAVVEATAAATAPSEPRAGNGQKKGNRAATPPAPPKAPPPPVAHVQMLQRLERQSWMVVRHFVDETQHLFTVAPNAPLQLRHVVGFSMGMLYTEGKPRCAELRYGELAPSVIREAEAHFAAITTDQSVAAAIAAEAEALRREHAAP